MGCSEGAQENLIALRHHIFPLDYNQDSDKENPAYNFFKILNIVGHPNLMRYDHTILISSLN